MDDPVYAEKYADGAERFDLLGKAKQAIDARHTEGLDGVLYSGGGQVRPDSGESFFGGGIGKEEYVSSWATQRASLNGYYGHDDGFIGLDFVWRLQPPSRVAPFVGIGTFNGFSKEIELATDDNEDNDGDGDIDEFGELETKFDGWLSAIYPEVGIHTWLNGSCRLTTFGRYWVTTEGRDSDEWMLGIQLSFFERDDDEEDN